MILQDGVRNKMQQDEQINSLRIKVSGEVMIRAEYIASCWSYPTYTADEELLAMNLKLCPSEFVHCIIPNIITSHTPRMELASRILNRHPSLDILRPYIQHPVTITSRSFPTVTRHKLMDTADSDKMDSWRKIDNAMEKMNVMIEEVEQELRSTSSYVKNLLNCKPMTIPAEKVTTINVSDKISSSNSSIPSNQKLELDSPLVSEEQDKFINDDRYSLDSNREPECNLEIEKLNLDLLSPQPTVHNAAIVRGTALLSSENVSKKPSPVIPDSLRSDTTPSPLPVWLKLLPVKQKKFLLSLNPVINQAKETNKNENMPKIQSKQIKLLKIINEEKQLQQPNNLKFELVTTITATRTL